MRFRSCQNPYKAKILEETYSDFGSVCDTIRRMVDVNRLCNISEPDQPPLTDVPKGKENELIHKYAEDNIAVIKIFVKDPYYTNIQRDEAMSTVSFVANAGGLMGLCVGLSFVSIFEIFYHLMNACWIQLCGKKKRSGSADRGPRTGSLAVKDAT